MELLGLYETIRQLDVSYNSPTTIDSLLNNDLPIRWYQWFLSYIQPRRTALSFCAQRGHREAFTVLLERGAHTETADAIGHTAASWAAKMGQKHIAPLEEM